MKKTKAFDLNDKNKLLLVAGAIVITIALLVWGVIGNNIGSNFHGASLTPFTPLSKMHKIDGPRFVPPNEPVEKIRKDLKTIKTIKKNDLLQKDSLQQVDVIKEIELETTYTKSR